MKAANNLERRAVIDVGTNSVKLLVADVGRTLKPVLKLSRQTRLGQGAFRTGHLQPEAITRTTAVVGEYVAMANALHPVSLRILTTSITRETPNAQELVQAIRGATGLNAEIISGEQEAEYVFHGVTSDPEIGKQPVLIADVGGGSTEWVVGEAPRTYLTHSTCLGTTRLLEMSPPSDPPSSDDLARCRQAVTEFLGHEVEPRLRPVLAAFGGRPVCFVGLGGALKSLARLVLGVLPEGDAPILLQREQIRTVMQRLWHLPVQERRSLAGINPDKADIILAGAVIYEAIMSQFDFTALLASSHGLRNGVLMAGRV